jgi:uncharacterized membrane protein YgaE (UPF0421/DUF939 family)
VVRTTRSLSLVLARTHLTLATRAAIAAVIAWLVVVPLDLSENVHYYAPFGAVVAVTSTFANSLREAAQVLAAIATAALVATAVSVLSLPTAAAIAAVVVLGGALGGSRHLRLGNKGSWVPISSLLVLIVGGAHPVPYIASYLGLTTLGAVVGVLVNGVFPPLPIAATTLEVNRMRTCLAEQLDELVVGLRDRRPPTARQWQRRRHRLGPQTDEMRSSVLQTVEARRGNWRARNRRHSYDVQRRQAGTLQHLAGLVEELLDLLVEQEAADASQLALGEDLRPAAADALEALARVLRAETDRDQQGRTHDVLARRMEDLRSATRRAWRESEQDRFTAATIVTDLERATESLRPRSSSDHTGG